jgi:hypothetical protein
MSHKLGIIVPYRDRYQQLIQFKTHIKNYLSDKDIKYELIVVEQDNQRAFNRGKLLNVGFLYAKKLNCDYVVFHDIDMLPIDVDYSYFDVPLHLATDFLTTNKFKRIVFDEYFGGVTLFPVELFDQVNGYSNKYWGWGYEDTDLLYRCELEKLPLKTLSIEQKGGNTAALKFNGINSYVEANNIFDFKYKNTIFISFFPDEVVMDSEKSEDTYACFGISGYDFLIGYNSFSRYVIQIFDENNDIIHLQSNIVTNYKTNIAITIDTYEKEIRLYQDGLVVDYKKIKRLKDYYTKERHFYLGCTNPQRKTDSKFFKGTISNFAVFSDLLSEEEIREISKNEYFGLTQNFGNYKSDSKLVLYYDAKFIKGYKLMDLSGNGNDAQIYNCEIVGEDYEHVKQIEVPYRRNCTFQLIPHEENGYVLNGWKSKLTRYNQLRFYNEVKRGSTNYKEDGLSDCEFVEHSNVKINNFSHIIVGI